jgi:hypothetical protein
MDLFSILNADQASASKVCAYAFAAPTISKPCPAKRSLEPAIAGIHQRNGPSHYQTDKKWALPALPFEGSRARKEQQSEQRVENNGLIIDLRALSACGGALDFPPPSSATGDNRRTHLEPPNMPAPASMTQEPVRQQLPGTAFILRSAALPASIPFHPPFNLPKITQHLYIEQNGNFPGSYYIHPRTLKQKGSIKQSANGLTKNRSQVMPEDETIAGMPEKGADYMDKEEFQRHNSRHYGSGSWNAFSTTQHSATCTNGTVLSSYNILHPGPVTTSDDVCQSKEQATDSEHAGVSIQTSENRSGALRSAIFSVQSTTRPETAVHEAANDCATLVPSCQPDYYQEEARDELIGETVGE